MRKSIKCGIAAAVVMAAGFAAYQTYGAYGAQDNSLLMQNIEALAQNPEPNGDPNGDGNSSIKKNSAMASGHCAAKGKIYECYYKIKGVSHSVKLGFIDGKGFVKGGVLINPPSFESKIRINDNVTITYGEYAVCQWSLMDYLQENQCDRCKQKLCSNSYTDLCNTDCRIPDDAVKN